MTKASKKMAKITMATVKSFIRKNEGALYIQCNSFFAGMIDGCPYDKNSKFVKAQKPDAGQNHENCLNVHGAWFVGSSRDRLMEFEDKDFKGISVHNCCVSFILAIPK